MYNEIPLTKDKNLTKYPYGGLIDKQRKEKWLNYIPITYSQHSVFDSLFFNEDGRFILSSFNKGAKFSNCEFSKRADFFRSNFLNTVSFENTIFMSDVDFGNSDFRGDVNFWTVKFNSKVDFFLSHFYNISSFVQTNFKDSLRFMSTYFDSSARFILAEFDSLVDFSYARIASKIIFDRSDFRNKVVFRKSFFSSQAIVEFLATEVRDTLLLGTQNSSELQKYDFLRAKLLPAGKRKIIDSKTNAIHKQKITYPGAKLLLFGPVDLKIQLEKFKFLALYDSLDYYAKKDIISILKGRSFKDEQYKKERFELDYLFAKSTIYQRESVNYDDYSAWHPLSWGQFLYNITMGLGYRPFRLVWWILAVIIGFGVFYIATISQKINLYIATEEQIKDLTKKKSVTPEDIKLSNTIINCFYFSTMVLFTFRLKRNILTFFDVRETRIIVAQWLIGFLIYIAFLTLSKSGSVLHTLKSLIG